MRKLFQVLNVSTITEPIHLSLLLEYFTYPTKSKVTFLFRILVKS